MSNRAGATNLWLMPLPAASGPVRLTSGPGPDTGTVSRFSPAGRFIAFSPDRSFGAGVFVVPAAGGEPRRLSETGGWPVWCRFLGTNYPFDAARRPLPRHQQHGLGVERAVLLERGASASSR